MLLASLAVFLGGVYVWIEREGREPEKVEHVERAATVAIADERTSSSLATPDTQDAPARERATPAIGRLVNRATEGAACAVHGRLEDEAGAPVVNVGLLISPVEESVAEAPKVDGAWAPTRAADDRREPSVARTDDAGRFAVDELACGRWQLFVSANGYEPAQLELGDLAARTLLDDVIVRLTRLPRLRVRVKWPDGTPAAAALISAPTSAGERFVRRALRRRAPDAFAEFASSETHEPRTDAQGLVEIPIERQDEWQVSASAERAIDRAQRIAIQGDVRELLGDRELEWTGAAHGRWPPPVETSIVLAPRPCVVGRVVDASGQPIARARVETWLAVDDRLVSGGGSEPVDRDGVYVAEGLDLGHLSLVVTAGGAYTWEVADLDTSVAFQRHDFTLLRAPTLAGIVRDPRGQPGAGVPVSVQWIEDAGAAATNGSSAADAASEALALRRKRFLPSVSNQRNLRVASDDAGRFRFDCVPAGRVRVTTSVQDGLPSAPLELIVAGDQDQLDLQLHLRDGATIEGRAYGRDGVRLSGRILHFFPEGDEEHVQSGLVDDAGTFRLNRVEPGRWVLRMPLDEEAEDADETAHIEPVILTQTIEVADGARVSVVLAPK